MIILSSSLMFGLKPPPLVPKLSRGGADLYTTSQMRWFLFGIDYFRISEAFRVDYALDLDGLKSFLEYVWNRKRAMLFETYLNILSKEEAQIASQRLNRGRRFKFYACARHRAKLGMKRSLHPCLHELYQETLSFCKIENQK